MKKGIIFGIVIIVLAGAAVLGIRFFSGEDNWICQNGEWIKHGNPKEEKPKTACGSESAKTNENESQEVKEEANIVVFSPKKNENANSPLEIEGKARVFENVVSIRLKEKSGKILFQGTTNAQSPDVGQFGLFQEDITFNTTASEGILEIYQASPRDGSDADKVSIPLKFGVDEEENE